MPDRLGNITYGKDRRVPVVIVRHRRLKPEAIDKITDQERLDLFRTMTAYGGAYKFDGKTVEHSIDIAWKKISAATKQIRSVTREGDRLTLTTPPFSFPHRRQGQREHARLGERQVIATPDRVPVKSIG